MDRDYYIATLFYLGEAWRKHHYELLEIEIDGLCNGAFGCDITIR